MILREKAYEHDTNRKWALEIGPQPKHISIIFMKDGTPWPRGWMGSIIRDKYVLRKVIRTVLKQVKL